MTRNYGKIPKCGCYPSKTLRTDFPFVERSDFVVICDSDARAAGRLELNRVIEVSLCMLHFCFFFL